MSKDLIKSATIKANKAELNYIDFKGDDIGISMRPELVHRTELHPVISDEGELESRVYYTLHNDAGGAVYLSPSMHAENVNNITQVVVPGPYEPAIPTLPDAPPPQPVLPPLPPSIDPPIEPNGPGPIDPDGPLPPDNPYWPGPNIDLPPYPPIEPPEPIDPSGGGGGGGGGTGGAPSGPAPQGGNFDDYAQKLVDKVEPFATNKKFKRVENVLKWHHNNRGMVSAIRAMKGTRGVYINPHGIEMRSNEGKKIDETYNNLINGTEMYAESNITRARISAPVLVNASGMFRDAKAISSLSFGNLDNLEDVSSFIENVRTLKTLNLKAAKKIKLASSICRNSNVRNVELDTTALEDISGAFHLSNVEKIITIENGKQHKVNLLYFPKVTNGTSAFNFAAKIDPKTCHCPELKEGSFMFAMSGLTSTNSFKFPKLLKMDYMFNHCKNLVIDKGEYGTNVEGTLYVESAYSYSSIRVAAGKYGQIYGEHLFANMKDLEYIIVPPGGLSKAVLLDYMCQGSPGVTAFFTLDSSKVTEKFNDSNIPSFDNLKCVDLAECQSVKGMFSDCKNMRVIAVKFGKETIDGLIGNSSTTALFAVNPNLEQVKFIANNVKSVKNLLLGSAKLTNAYVGAEKAKDATGLFRECTQLTANKLKYKLDNVIKIDSMLEGCTSIKGTYDFGVLPKLCYAKDVMKNTGITHARGTFGSYEYGFNSIKDVFKNSNVIISNISFPGAGDARAAFYNNLKIQKVGGLYSRVTTADFMFKGCTSLTHVNVDMYSLVTARYMFRDCSALKDVRLIDINTHGYVMPSLKDAYNMFAFSSIDKVLPYRFPSLQTAERMYNGASQLSGTVSFTINKENEPAEAPASGQYPKVWNTLYMFRATNIDTIADLNLSNVSNGIGMFAECYNLQHVTGEVTFRNRGDYQNMFDCSRFDEASAEKIIRAANAADVVRMHVGLGFTPPRDENGSVTLGGLTFSHVVSNRELQWQGDGRWISIRFNG